jgi:alpha-beta hydrolase superfamily lysophospholipase
MSKELTIYFDADQYRLTGTLHLPPNPRPGVIIGCHGLKANRHSPKQIALAKVCNRAGLAYFRFDHRGCGDSQGDFDQVTSLAARCQDLRQAMTTLEDLTYLGPLIGLFGSSFGGTTVLCTAAQRPVPKIVTFAAPIESRSLMKSVQDKKHPPLSLRQALDFDITPLLGAISNILVGHGQNDDIVPAGHAEIIYSLAQEPKKLVLQPGGDHPMSNPAHQQSFREQFIDWFQKR